MKDFFGTEVEVDDIVVVCQKNYRNFIKAKIISVAPTGVRVEYSRGGSFKETYFVSYPSFVKQPSTTIDSEDETRL